MLSNTMSSEVAVMWVTKCEKWLLILLLLRIRTMQFHILPHGNFFVCGLHPVRLLDSTSTL